MRKYSLYTVFALVLAGGTWGCGGETSSDDSASTTPATGNGQGGTNTTSAQAPGQGGAGSTPTAETPTNTTLAKVDCTDTATVKLSLGTRYAAADIPVTDKTKVYRAATNWWHKFTTQTVDINGLGFVVHNTDQLAVPQTDGAPIGYPTLYVGSYSGSSGAGSNLPKQVSALTSVPTIFDTNATSLDTSNLNAAYDVWFTATGTPLPETQYSPGKGGAFLMVWLFDPAQRQPRGTNKFPAHTIPGVDGTWDVWIDPSDPPCISYVSTTPMSSLAFDLNYFIQDSVDNQYGVTESMYLSVVFAGFEIWGNGDGLQLKQFCADVK